MVLIFLIFWKISSLVDLNSQEIKRGLKNFLEKFNLEH